MDYIWLGVGLLLIVGTGLFVASEFALVNLDRADLEARRDRGESRLGMTIAALKITSTHLSSAQLGLAVDCLMRKLPSLTQTGRLPPQARAGPE